MSSNSNPKSDGLIGTRTKLPFGDYHKRLKEVEIIVSIALASPIWKNEPFSALVTC